MPPQLLIAARGPAEGELGEPLWPAVDDRLALRFEPGETIRWRGQVDMLSEVRRLPDRPDEDVAAWTMTELSDFVVTDRRLVYAVETFSVDRTGPGARMAAGVRAAWRSLPEGGRVLTGQVRFQWPVEVFVQTNRVPWRSGFVCLSCLDGDRQARLVFGWLQRPGGLSVEQRAADFARTLTSDIARFRLQGPGQRPAQAEIGWLQTLRDQGTPSATEPVLRFRLPGAVPIGSEEMASDASAPAPRVERWPERIGEAAVQALRLAAREAGDSPVGTREALLGACQVELEHWTPILLRLSLSVEALRTMPVAADEPAAGGAVLVAGDPEAPDLAVTPKLALALQMAELLVVGYGFAVVAPAHLALAVALVPGGSGAALLGSRGAPPGEVVAVISETLFNTDFVDLHRLADQLPAAAAGPPLAGPSPAAAGPMHQAPGPLPAAAGPVGETGGAPPVAAGHAPVAAGPPAGAVVFHPPGERQSRLGLLERVGVIGLCLVVLLTLWTLGGLRSTSAAAGELERAREAFGRGDVRGVVRSGDQVLRVAPRSLPALVLNSCATWDVGYTDEAVVYYQRALMAGLPWNRLVVNRPCFLNAPTYHGLRMQRVAGLPILYAAPKGKTGAGAALEAIVIGRAGPATRALVGEARTRNGAASDSRPKPGQSMLAAACLNDRSDLRLLAASHLTMALNDPALPPVKGVLRRCLGAFRGRYVFEERDGREFFWPKDLGDRRFMPDSSPIPGRVPRRLP